MAIEVEDGYAAVKKGDEPTRLWQLFVVASIAAGVQFGWALQLSLLTPYVQQLGVPHALTSFIWLCGPISGLLVQPIVGHFSDHCTLKFGRRRPFIVAGAALVIIAVIFIGFAADIGHQTGDILDRPTKPRAVAIFVVGFWILDVANNMLQGPCRAFLADLSGGDQQMIRSGNYAFALFMALGNILGYGAGTIKNLHKVLPFAMTEACDIYCANLKTCFIFDIVLLLIVTTVAVCLVKETPFTEQETTSDSGFGSFIRQFWTSLKNLKKPMWLLFLVTGLNWIGWFPFLLYDTDWVGADVYGGKPQGTPQEKNLYDVGVRAGAMGLLINSVVLGFASIMIMVGEHVSNRAKSLKSCWAVVNVLLSASLVLTVPVTKAAKKWRRTHGLVAPPSNIRDYAFAIFSVLGVPLAVNYSVPFALASIYSTSGSSGQGLSLGLLNLSIVIPQMIVSLVSGYLDKLAGGGNLPAFILGACAAAVSSLFAFILLPNPSSLPSPPMSFVAVGGH